VHAQDSAVDVAGFVENVTYDRDGRGLSKVRNTLQLEISKALGNTGRFTDVGLNLTLRGSYDAVYDVNDDEFGAKAGGAITLEQVGVPANAVFPGAPAFPAASVAHGSGIVLPQGDFDSVANPNDGLVVLGQYLHSTDGGIAFGVPVRPCDVDSRGCIKDYLDFDENELKFPEFNSRVDVIREIYVNGNLPLSSGNNVYFTFGRQQVVWGRTDLFRVLDVINPVDFSRNNIYDELEDIRIPMGIFTAEYQWGATEVFDDINLQFVWKFEEFRPNMLGQGGTPNAILDAGSFFRGMKNCWDNGCTVANFAAGGVATDFAPNTIGIRQANLPGGDLDETEYGLKIEGVFKNVGFSLNYYRFWQQLPTLRAGIPSDNAFTPVVEADSFPYLISFDIDFPRVSLVGGSLDLYLDSIKSVLRVEAAYTTGEEFANTLQPRLFSESDVVRWVLGVDRSTFIPFLNKKRAYLLSMQVFGQHLLDYERQTGLGGLEVGMPDHDDNYIATLLIKGWYKNDRLSPQVIIAHDFGAKATAIVPSLDWLINNNWRLTALVNIKTGTGAQKFDDCRDCNPFPPFTATPAHPDPFAPGPAGALSGFEPLGRFQSGPIGMGLNEDEVQLAIRYRF
jgi:hypothetical protein